MREPVIEPPADLPERLTKIMGEERAMRALRNVHASGEHWETLAELMVNDQRTDFMEYAHSLNESELIHTLMYGLAKEQLKI